MSLILAETDRERTVTRGICSGKVCSDRFPVSLADETADCNPVSPFPRKITAGRGENRFLELLAVTAFSFENLITRRKFRPPGEILGIFVVSIVRRAVDFPNEFGTF